MPLTRVCPRCGAVVDLIAILLHPHCRPDLMLARLCTFQNVIYDTFTLLSGHGLQVICISYTFYLTGSGLGMRLLLPSLFFLLHL